MSELAWKLRMFTTPGPATKLKTSWRHGTYLLRTHVHYMVFWYSLSITNHSKIQSRMFNTLGVEPPSLVTNPKLATHGWSSLIVANRGSQWFVVEKLFALPCNNRNAQNSKHQSFTTVLPSTLAERLYFGPHKTHFPHPRPKLNRRQRRGRAPQAWPTLTPLALTNLANMARLCFFNLFPIQTRCFLWVEPANLVTQARCSSQISWALALLAARFIVREARGLLNRWNATKNVTKRGVAEICEHLIRSSLRIREWFFVLIVGVCAYPKLGSTLRQRSQP